jgi:hypothetical protein
MLTYKCDQCGVQQVSVANITADTCPACRRGRMQPADTGEVTLTAVCECGNVERVKMINGQAEVDCFKCGKTERVVL